MRGIKEQDVKRVSQSSIERRKESPEKASGTCARLPHKRFGVLSAHKARLYTRADEMTKKSQIKAAAKLAMHRSRTLG